MQPSSSRERAEHEQAAWVFALLVRCGRGPHDAPARSESESV